MTRLTRALDDEFAVIKAGANTIAVVLASLLLTTPAAAQCTDGSPPPCRQRGAATRPVPIDSNRVAIIPFRVTTADSLLGEGFAELLAPEFTGEGGPRSIDMSSTLAAWRRAGGGLRTPLSQGDAMRVARQLGAGVLCQGSIVGVGGRLTISASLVNASSGRPIGNTARAAGSPDSMEILLGQVAAGLLGAGTRVRTADAGRLTKSPAAMRAYFEGMAMWRRGNRPAAERALEASFAADTMFASAAFQRWLLSALLSGDPEWARRTLTLKERLTPRERIVVDGTFGVDPAATRSYADITADLRRAALLVDSPEAWYLFGDNVYHNGLPVVGPDSVLPIAREAFARAMALDSQPISFDHLVSIALRARDSALTRRLGRFVDRLDGEDRWSKGWVIAAVRHDAAQLAKLRQIGPHRQATVLSGLALLDALDTPIPMALVDEGFRHLNAVSGSSERGNNERFLWLIHRAHGRPTAAERSIAGQTPPHWRDSVPGGPWHAFSGDLRDDDAFMRAFGALPLVDAAAEQRRQCVAARLIAQRGHADSLNVVELRQRTDMRCARILEIWKAFATDGLTAAALTDLDAIVTSGTAASFRAFEHRLLSRIYEERGDTARALRAIRLYPRDFPGVWLAPTLREEGRYYLMARDTANAIQSYDHFLELRAEAEPPYVAERDSIRALVAKLARRP